MCPSCGYGLADDERCMTFGFDSRHVVGTWHCLRQDVRNYARTRCLSQKECFDVIGLRVSTHQAQSRLLDSDSRRASGVDRLILGYGHIACAKLNEEADLRAR